MNKNYILLAAGAGLIGLGGFTGEVMDYGFGVALLGLFFYLEKYS